MLFLVTVDYLQDISFVVPHNFSSPFRSPVHLVLITGRYVSLGPLRIAIQPISGVYTMLTSLILLDVLANNISRHANFTNVPTCSNA